MKRPNFATRYFYVVIIMVINLLASCNSIPTKNHAKNHDEVLIPAQQALVRAQAFTNPAIETELAQAKEMLERAKNANDEEEKKHLAFLAQRRAEIAITIAERHAYQQQTERLTRGQKRHQVKKVSHQPATPRQRVEDQQLSQKLADWKNNRRGQLVIVLREQIENGSMTLSEKLRAKIDTVADFLRQHPHFKVILEGYTDSHGNFQHNQGLSERWASDIKFTLMKRGISSNRMVVKGLGEASPIASNYSAAGREKNRRVELVIFDEYVPIFAPAASVDHSPTSSFTIQYQ